MTAYSFWIRAKEGDQALGYAVLCPEARYCSVTWANHPRVERRFPSAAEWKAVLTEVGDRLPASPLPDTGAIATLVLGDRARSKCNFGNKDLVRGLRNPHERVDYFRQEHGVSKEEDSFANPASELAHWDRREWSFAQLDAGDHRDRYERLGRRSLALVDRNITW